MGGMHEPDNRMEQLAYEAETRLRHHLAIRASDEAELRLNLQSAADRFDDIADQLERDRSYDPVAFMRASARRYRRAAGDEFTGTKTDVIKQIGNSVPVHTATALVEVL